MARETEAPRWLFLAYVALLMWAPIPLGSNRPWSTAVLEVSTFLMASTWLFRVSAGMQQIPATARHASPALWLLFAWTLYVWAQLVPLPMGVLEWISPQAARWYLAAAAPDYRAFAPITVDAYATLEAACRTTAFAAFFALGLVLLTSRDRVRAAAAALVVSGLLQAAYAAGTATGGVVTGSFVNQNHFAAYLVMCLSMGIGLLISGLTGARHDSWRDFFRNAFLWAVTPRLALRLALMVIVIALVMTRSRMGNMSFFAAMLVAGVIGLVLSRHATRSMVILLVSLVVVDIFIVGTYFGAERVVQRLAESSAITEDRDEVSGYALALWKDYPLFGVGLGAFSSAFPMYSGAGTIGTYTHAHNDFLEFAAEAGIAGIAILGAFVTAGFAATLRAHAIRHDPLMRGMSFAAIMSIIAMMTHSAVDFSLQIPANALTFMTVLSIAWISRFHSDDSRRAERRRA